MKTKDMTKQQYIGTYVGKKMKGNKLPYGLAYLNLVSKHEEVAEKYWKRMINRIITTTGKPKP